jgi:protocatechuate 3,4-dioxygenase beta subunit
VVAVLLWWQLERARDAPERTPVRQEEAVPGDLSRRSPGGAKADPAEDPAARDPVPNQLPASGYENPPLLLEGRVLHADGRPAKGAEVSTGWGGTAIASFGVGPYAWRTTTDEAGRYRFLLTISRTRLPKSLDVRARLDDQVAMPETVDEPRTPFTMRDLVLEDGLQVCVRVRNSARAPVAGAHGFLAVFRDGVTEHRRLVAWSDEEGLLAFFPLRKSAEWSLRLTVTHPSYPKTEKRLDLAGQRAGKIGEVVLPLGIQVRGRVTDPEGKPRSGVYVVAASLQEDALKAQWNLQAETDAKGAFVVNGIPAGEGRLLLYPDLTRPASSFSTTRRSPWLSDSFTGTNGGVIDLGTIVMHPAGTISGRVIDADGTPLKTATVGVRVEFRGLTSPWTTTGADGSFTLWDIPPGEYTLHASQARGEKGVLEGEVKGVRPDGPEVTVQLKIKPGIVLRFFSAQNPTERVATDALGYTCQRSPDATSGFGGMRSRGRRTWYRLDKQPGVWYVKVSVPGYEEVDFGKVTLPADKDLVLDVFLRKAE